ncbi:MAG: hypothetical protein RIS09_674, partial [Actinomycetota bacterium]
MTSLQLWYLGARPKTLPAALAPVIVASSLSFFDNAFDVITFLLAGIVALALQIGVNYANDYSDGIKGTDDVRVGPLRLVASKSKSATAVKTAAMIIFLVAAVAGLLLTLHSGVWWFIPLGILAIISAWFYTGGNNPYGYKGLGEISVFVWFGLVAVLATYFAYTKTLTFTSLVVAIGAGAFACALLVINNLRDRAHDAEVQKRTLAVRLGDSKTRFLYVALVWIGFTSSAIVSIIYVADRSAPAFAGIGFLASVLAHRPGRSVLSGSTGKDLITVLQQTSKTQM